MSQSMELVSLNGKQLQALLQQPDQIFAFTCYDVSDNQPQAMLSLEDAWHVLQYMITEPTLSESVPVEISPSYLSLSYILEGEFLKRANCDYCHCLYPEDVNYAVTALANFETEHLRQRHQSDAFQTLDEDELYRYSYWRKAESFDELAHYFSAFKQFFNKAAEQKLAVIYYIK